MGVCLLLILSNDNQIAVHIPMKLLSRILPLLLAAIAQNRDKERKQGNWWGTMHGIPVLLKDNIITDKMHSTAGAAALKDWRGDRAFRTRRVGILA